MHWRTTVTELPPEQFAVPPERTARRGWPRLMANSIRRYEWGSQHVLASLQGRGVSEHPEAELWMGAHPLAPSVLLDADGHELSLADAIAHDPWGTLGPRCLTAYGERLPFLLKVLAVERPLSVQVHPTTEQARAGFAREEAAGVPRDAASRVYADPYAKPEMLFAVTEFEALAGLREPREAALLLDLLDVDRLGGLRRLLGGADDVVAALALLVAWPQEERRRLVREVAAGARAALRDPRLDRAVRAGHASPTRHALAWVLSLAGDYPQDPFVLAPLLLGLHRLAPGGTLYVPAGVPHAYLSGVGVEIMASSDNVVRAGLTGKHVDSQALLELLDPAAQPLLGVPFEHSGLHAVTYLPPVADFRLTRVVVGGGVADGRGDPTAPDGGAAGETLPDADSPQVLLCLTGEVEVRTGEHHVLLRAGESAFLGADAAGPVVLAGTGEVFCAEAGY